ncbi:unnamed protein product [Rhizoctonia solani]|uniref:Uncharacterized protein n=1 Tax=Rhizoctonia solani TaxID=456999 RepID=A0A8H3A3F7_9AGAM|nr:unnamed protein product [Rhizoctonia solani]
MAPQLSNTHASDRSRDEMVTAAKKKLKTFRAKQTQSSVSSAGSISRRRSHSRGSSVSELLPSLTVATEAPRQHQKRRSHSRSASVLKLDSEANLPSVTLPLSPAKPANLGDLNRSFSFGAPRPAASPMSSPPPPSSPPCSQQTTPRPRPSSHHRRRSSVSTRRDSVDMMGFDPAALNSLKTMGESDKDDVAKVRERALLALEGKTPSAKARNIPEIISNIGFAKVEIPEWKTPDVERTFDWGATTHRPKSLPFSINLNGALATKRDSFGKNLVPTASSKGELAVLVEEEEEEESSTADKENVPLSQPVAPTPEPVSTPVSSPTKPSSLRSPSLSPSRPRPASLNLKALTMASTTVVSLPTPSATPSPTPGARPGMKPLNLGNATRRQSMVTLSSNSPRNSLPASRRQSLRSQSRDSASTHSSKDSLSAALGRLPPTPNTMSPTSAVEGFLQKNQEVLISRIDQLEKALASSRRASVQSNMSYSSVASSIAEEQINLIAELKSERNTLVEEIAGWRTRVQDLERQAELYLNKINSERTESKLARDRVLELEKEQGTWESDRAAFNNAIARAREDGASWRAKYEEALKGECHWQAKALGLDSDVKRLEKELAALRTVTPTKKWNVILSPRRFDDSMSSTSTADVRDEAYVVSTETEVFKIRPRPASPLPNMDVVVEEEENEVYESSCEEPSLDDNEPRCVEEDEDEVCSAMLDEINGDLSDSESVDSFTSQYTQPQLPTFQESQPSFKFPGDFPEPAPAPSRGHARTGSMIKGWQMPRGPVQGNNRSPAKPDRFFDQLEHLYATSDEEPTTPTNSSFGPGHFGSPEFNTFKGDGGASSFKFGSKRNSISHNFRGHGTRASRGSISVSAFNGLGMPPFMNPNPEWIVKNELPEPLSPTPGPKTNTDAHLGEFQPPCPIFTLSARPNNH